MALKYVAMRHKKKSLRHATSFVLAGCIATALPLNYSLANYANFRNIRIDFLVTITSRPCTLNDNKTIEVNFKDVQTTQINGVNYRTPINYSLSCPNGEPALMKLQVLGGVSTFENTALQTSVTGLGIQVQNGNTAIPIGSWINFTYPNIPKLFVVPIRKADVGLPGGAFTSVATLKLEYQ
ncbi:TPA: fimbrial protein [Enterobacter kobei]|uniref:fimbrial protein n=1 Tax=Enterobacter kobei TaxID=208224 RepID=UPI002B1621CA|nr:fimbrial protein [Enterobacter kobei]HCM9166468.1 fimbrial protein [Enterobacter kobei]HEP0934962.1 fimbrial protein [Enterobacter roggenkampii]